MKKLSEHKNKEKTSGYGTLPFIHSSIVRLKYALISKWTLLNETSNELKKKTSREEEKIYCRYTRLVVIFYITFDLVFAEFSLFCLFYINIVSKLCFEIFNIAFYLFFALSLVVAALIFFFLLLFFVLSISVLICACEWRQQKFVSECFGKMNLFFAFFMIDMFNITQTKNKINLFVWAWAEKLVNNGTIFVSYIFFS